MPTHTMHLPNDKRETLGAFIMRPARAHFATQGPNESILLFLRQHPITQIPWIATAILLMLIPLVVFPFFGEINIFSFTLPPLYTIVITLFWYLATFAFIFVNFILWYYNINIVTNLRVVDIDFIYLLVQEVAATRITHIEDVAYKRIGVFALLFDYGDVFIQTAGAEANIEFLRIPHPKRVTQLIIELMGENRP